MGAGIAYLSWDGDAVNAILPHRVSTDNMGGDDLENDELNPPGPGEPDATAWDAKVREIAALAQTAAAAKITITFDAGAPQIELFASAGTITSASITLEDEANGTTLITWPANSFPPASSWPELTLHAEGTGFVEVDGITDGLRVTTKNLAGTLTDIAFTVAIN